MNENKKIFVDMDSILFEFSKQNQEPINLSSFLNSSSSKEDSLVNNDDVEEKIDIEF